MNNPKISLPYFDLLLEQFNQDQPGIEEAFGHHVHWGYWPNPTTATGSVNDFFTAAEQLSQLVYNTGKIENGYSVLDAGCGFGGTIASLNQRFTNLQLVGLNIDPRQIERAKEKVKASYNNQISFVEGDACELPFEDSSFDVVLAVECIFHFPSRERFFQEVKRVLKPGGKLAISDFVPLNWTPPLIALAEFFIESSIGKVYGPINSQFTLANYRKLAENTGFKLIHHQDITKNTLPTYPVVCQIFREIPSPEAEKVTHIIEWLSSSGLLRYLVLGFEAC